MIQINDIPVIQNTYPDGSSRIQLTDEILRSIKAECNILMWNYESDDEIFIIKALSEKFMSLGFSSSNLFLILGMPYIPHARMDRHQAPVDIVTLKTLANIINSCGFAYVTVFDPHSDVSEALINRVTIERPYHFTTKVLCDIEYRFNQRIRDTVLFFPDAGAEKRYSWIYRDMGHPFTYGIKHRDWKTGKIQSLEVVNPELVKGKTVLIIDDICSYGGTFALAATKLREAGAGEIFLQVSHCENSIFNGSLLEPGSPLTHIYTTDSIFMGEHKKMTVAHIEWSGHIKDF